MEERAKKAIEKLDGTIRKLPNVPSSFTYINLLQAAQQLFVLGNYELVCAICENACDSLARTN